MNTFTTTLRQIFVKEPTSEYDHNTQESQNITTKMDSNRTLIAWALRIPAVAVLAGSAYVGANAYIGATTGSLQKKYADLAENSTDSRTQYLALERLLDEEYSPELAFSIATKLPTIDTANSEFLQEVNLQARSEELLKTLAPLDKNAPAYAPADLLFATRDLRTIKQVSDLSDTQKIYFAERAKLRLERSFTQLTPNERKSAALEESLGDTLVFLGEQYAKQHKYDLEQDAIEQLAEVSPARLPNALINQTRKPTKEWLEDIQKTAFAKIDEEKSEAERLKANVTKVEILLAMNNWEEANQLFKYRTNYRRFGNQSEDDKKTYAAQLQAEMFGFYKQTASQVDFKAFSVAIKENEVLTSQQKNALLKHRLSFLPVGSDVEFIAAYQSSFLHNSNTALEQWIIQQLTAHPDSFVKVYAALRSVHVQDVLRPLKITGAPNTPIEKMAELYAWDTEYTTRIARKEYVEAHAVLLQHAEENVFATEQLLQFYSEPILECSYEELKTIISRDAALSKNRTALIVSNWMLQNNHPATQKFIAQRLVELKNNQADDLEVALLKVNFVASVLSKTPERIPAPVLAQLAKVLNDAENALPALPALKDLQTEIVYLQHRL